MMFYLEITGYIKNHQNFKILFWSRESEKMIFTIFPEKFYEKMGWKYRAAAARPPDYWIFSRKEIRKNRKNRFFGLPGPK